MNTNDWKLRDLKKYLAELQKLTKPEDFVFPSYFLDEPATAEILSRPYKITLAEVIELTKGIDPSNIQMLYVVDEGIRIQKVLWKTPEEEAAHILKWQKRQLKSNKETIKSIKAAINELNVDITLN